MIDKILLKKRFEKSLETYGDNAIVQNYMAAKLVNLLKDHSENSFDMVFEFGVGSANLTRLFSEEFTYTKLFLNDIVKKSENWAKKYVDEFEFIEGDIEKIEIPKHLNLVISNATVQWVKDFDKLIEKVADSLEPNAKFAFSTFGEDNFLEIQQVFSIGLKYLSKSEIEEKLGKHFRILETVEDRIELDFKTPKEVLKHIQNTGVNCMGLKNFYKSTFFSFEKDYKKLFSTPDGVKLTYHPIYTVVEKI